MRGRRRYWFWLLLLIPVGIGLGRLRFDVEVLNLLPDDLPAVVDVQSSTSKILRMPASSS